MASYILRDLPPDLWNRFKARAETERRPLKALFLDLIAAYADNRVFAPAGKGIAVVTDTEATPQSHAIVVLESFLEPAVVKGAASGTELDADLVILNAAGEKIARFARSDVKSWYIYHPPDS